MRGSTTAPGRSERIIADICGSNAGTCLVAFGGIHGNEHGGVTALERVAAHLGSLGAKGSACPANGRILALRGNIAALEQGVRFVDRDLNRGWSLDTADALRRGEGSTVEDCEARDLLTILDGTLATWPGPVVFLDLHSTSGQGRPFVCIPDTVENLRIALDLPVPSILGIEETVAGPLVGLMSDLGCAGLIVEGGQHDDPGTAACLESAVWVLLVALGLVRQKHAPDYGAHWNRLAAAGSGLPRVLEIVALHETRPNDGFQMLRRMNHYEHVLRGQVVARDHHGDVVARKSGRIVMPAYLPGTDQGFFIARDVPAIFVWILLALRYLRLDRACPRLPGAHRHADNRDLLDVSNWVPRRMVDIIRLLGWRRLAHEGDHTVLRRRRVRR